MITLDALVEQRDMLVSNAQYLTRNSTHDAEDLAHDTIVRALENQAKFDGKNLGGWLTRIQHGIWVDRVRQAVSQGEIVGLPSDRGWTM